MRCLRCGHTMELWRREKLQLGQTGWITGEWGNLLAGALPVDIWLCPHCGKLEFYTDCQCPHCGAWHDMDDARCPHCHADLGHRGEA